MIEFNNKKPPRIMVVGDLMIDKYMWGSCDRISPEAPVQILNVSNESSVLGGAGNVLNNLVALGAEVEIYSVIGSCDIAKTLRKMLSEINIKTTFLVEDKSRKTSIKTRLIASHQQIIRYDKESTSEISNEQAELIANEIDKNIINSDLIIISDYGKGVVTDYLAKKVIESGKTNKIKVLVDPKGKDYSKYSGAYLLTPNKIEASLASGIQINDDDDTKLVIKKLKKDICLSVSLITLSENGIAMFEKTYKRFPSAVRSVYDVTGAGDTVIASLGFALANGNKIEHAIPFANLAAGVVVGKVGSSTTTLNEIIEYESSLNKSLSYEHIKTFEDISQLSNEARNKGKKIVFTNGCFDILHSGHVSYLEKAKTFGDILIVGVNSDQSVKILKGEKRPINSQKDRAFILAALESVDYVVIFNEETPYELIKLISPNVLVKGADYEGEYVIGQDIADELELIEYLPGKSTTQLIDTIKNG